MRCPGCNAIVPNSWKSCRCGYDFQSPPRPHTSDNSDSTKPLERVSKPLYEKRDIREEYREFLNKETAFEKTRVLPVEELTTEVEGSGIPTGPGDSDTSGESTDQTGGISRKLVFTGNGTTLLGIHLMNIFLAVVTLGIYYFWGKIKARRYLYSQTEFEGDRFEFVGTGAELLLGFIKASVIMVAAVFLMEFGKRKYSGIYTELASGILVYIIILLLTPMALVFAQRYRFSRTSWRHIRFSFRGKVKHFLRIYIPGLILTTLTLGIYYYFLHHKSRKYLVDNAYFGDTKFSYDGEIDALFGKFIKAIILSLFTFGMYWFWFAAERHNYYWSHTKFKDTRFHLNIRGFDYLRLKMVDYMLILFTIGIAYPYVVIRDLKFFYRHLSLSGELDLFEIKQDSRSPSALGEEVADILDLDLVGMDLGI